MRSVLIILSFVFSVCAQAEIISHYRGTGQLDYGPLNPIYQCQNSFASIYRVGTDQISIEAFSGQCGEGRGEGLSPHIFTINGSDLLLNGQKVGTIADGAIEIQFTESWRTQSLKIVGDGETILMEGENTSPYDNLARKYRASLTTAGNLEVSGIEVSRIGTSTFSVPNEDGTSRLVVPNWIQVKMKVTNKSARTARLAAVHYWCSQSFGYFRPMPIDIPGYATIELPSEYVDMLNQSLDSVTCTVNFETREDMNHFIGTHTFSATK